MVNPYIAAPRTIAATVTTAITVTAGKHTPVDVTAGSLTITLPTISPGFAGAHLSIEKADSSTNTVTITGNIRGTTGTVTLNYSHETIEFHTDATGAWFPTANHLPKSSIDGIVAGLVNASTGQASAALATTYAPLAQSVQAQQYRTLAGGSQQLAQMQPAPFGPTAAIGVTPVFVNPSEQFQPILGFGAALTGSAAYCLWNYLSQAQRTALLTDLFSPAGRNWSMLRIGIGSTDFNADPQYTYDDGAADPSLANFSVQKDGAYIIPIIREILAINPRVRILACPWTIPGWMKATNPDFLHGTPDPGQFATLAQYMVKFVQAYRAYGIPIWAVTPMNEPFGASFSMSWTAAQMATYVGTYLGPAFTAAGLDVKILGHDDSWSGLHTDFSDAAAGPYYDGIAWHDYGSGSPSNGTAAKRSFPTKSQHLSEMRNLLSETYTQALGIMAGDLIVGAIRNWSESITLWNLALDQNGAPNYSGNTGRQGVVTITNDSSGTITRNTGYWAMAHVSQFLQPGARRIASTTYAIGKGQSAIETVAFINPDQSIILFCYNAGPTTTFQIGDGRTGQTFPVTMQTDEMSTFVWGTTKQSLPAGIPVTLAKPGAPTLTASGAPGSVNLTITAGSTGDAPISEYRIYRAVAGGTQRLIQVLPVSVTSFADTVAIGTYDYSVKAVNLAGLGVSSSTMTATAVAAAIPAAFTPAATASDSQVVVSWSAPAANGSAITGYTVRRGTSSGGETDLGSVQSNVATYTDTTASNGTKYYYTVVATNGVGSRTSSEVSATPASAPSPAIDAVATGTTGSSASTTVAHTVGTGSNRLLVVAVASSGAATVSGVTYGAGALTHLGSSLANSNGADPAYDRHVDLWYMVAPPSGTANVVATMSAATTMEVSSISLTLVNQTTPFGTPVVTGGENVATLSATATRTSGDLVLAAAAIRGSSALTPGSSQNARWSVLAGTNLQTAGTTQSTSGASSFSWTTADRGAMVAVPIHYN